jgi:curli biogenesis system outer membrane secretion channel CsgG
MTRRSAILLATIGLAALAAGAGCDGWRRDANAVRPTVAVMKFENRGGLAARWNLGTGLRDVLVDSLIATDRYRVVERGELPAVLGEIALQNSGATRAHGRAAQGRLKNAQYLIKGTITDFGHVSTDSGFLRGGDGGLFGRTEKAVVGLTLYVVEVESGEIIASQSIEDSVRSREVAVDVAYKGVAFGGSTFYRTPLGRATRKVIDKAVREIGDAVTARRWEPKLARVGPGDRVVINGGRSRGLREGDELYVLEAGGPILDPDTGDVLGQARGRLVGRVRVAEVHPRYSVATVTSGRPEAFRVGQLCRRPPEGTDAAAADEGT